MTELLEARALSKHYGSTIALDNATFSVQQGVTGMLGPNGAGKSTAMKLFLGLIQPTSGTATVMGDEPYRSLEGRARIGYMPEDESLPGNVAASEFLMHMAQVSGLPPPTHGAGRRTPFGTSAWKRSGTGPWANTPPA